MQNAINIVYSRYLTYPGSQAAVHLGFDQVTKGPVYLRLTPRGALRSPRVCGAWKTLAAECRLKFTLSLQFSRSSSSFKTFIYDRTSPTGSIFPTRLSS